uniref:Uncharacterized protein n=1 Tax=viral metagenome TaxID=1070528 RepID=A0A2V0RIY2_9ZZZZ
MPGKLYAMSITRKRNYTGTSFNPRLLEIGDPIKEALRDLNVSKVDTDADADIHGRSWEMACVMAAMGHTGAYSGIVWGYDNGLVIFGPVPGVHIKKKLINNLKTVKNIPSIRVPSR